MKIQSRPFSDEKDFQILKVFISLVMSQNMQQSYWHVGDLVWGIYQNTIFDPQKNVRLWENEQGDLLGFTWSNFHEIMLQVSPRLDSSEVHELLEQMLTWGKERREALSTNENTPSFYAFDDDLPLKNLFLRHKYQREESHMLHMRRDLDQPIPQRWVEEGVQGISDKSHANTSKTGVDLPTRNLIRKRQEENPLLAICEALEIEKEYIHPRQSWENLVETHFNVMRRMSQVHFEQVTSWQGAKLAHQRFVTDYNAQPHWAHRKRDDNRLSPAEVLGRETSKLRTPAQLHRIFYAMRFLRRLDRLGVVVKKRMIW